MTLFQLLVIIMGFVFLLFAIDLYQRRKFNLLHFLVFFGGTAIIVLFGMRQDFLDQFGQFFGIARGADLIVYLCIIFLLYLYLAQVNNDSKRLIETSKLVSAIACEKVNHNDLKKMTQHPGPVFLVRAYNEGSVLAGVLTEIIEHGYKKILLCDDGSTDNTQDIIAAIIKKFPDVALINLKHIINRGAGSANKTLFMCVKKYQKHFGTDWFVTFDADGQMDINDVKKFISTAENNPETKIFLGSRFIKGGVAKNISVPRRIILWGSKVITYVFDQIRVSDPHNGFRLLHYDALSEIQLTSDGMAYASDMIAQIQEKKIPFKELPVHIIYTEYSKSKGQKDTNAFGILKEILFRLFVYK